MATQDLTLDSELIVFDKDGTLVDLHAPWGKWAESVAASLDRIIPSGDLLWRLGWDAASERVEAETPLAIASLATLQVVVATWLYEAGLGWSEAMATSERALATAPRPPASPICPLTPLFETLTARGHRLAVVSTDDLDGVERDLTPLGVLPHLSTIIAGNAALPTKPAPDMVLAACRAVGVSPTRTVVVGDSVADMVMGRAAKVALTIGVLSGSGTIEDLSPHADVLVPTACALAPAKPGGC